MKTVKTKMLIAASVLFLGFTTLSCKDNNIVDVVKPDLTFFVVNSGNLLIKLNANNPNSSLDPKLITGLLPSDLITSIDFRPATGELYGVSSQSRIYIINQETGVARIVGTTALNPTVSGTAVGIDFNPTVDRIRLVTSTGQNLRLHPETGAVAATDIAINGGTSPKIESVAYTNNTAGATTTVLYDIDSQTDKLYKQDPPNNGVLVEVGGLGTDISMSAGFDVNPAGDVALAAMMVSSKWELHQIDLTTGKSTKLGDLPAGNITGLAIPTSPVAYAIDETNNLLIFNFLNIGTPISKTITGLQTGETILGIDMRPATGQLYALGSTSRLYVLNTSSGAASVIGTVPFATLLSGTSFGFDFNPTVDRIRCISNTGQNLRLQPETGLIAAIDGILNPGTPSVTASAYTNNFAGATTTVLFNIDNATDKLNRQDPPNNGTQVEIGALGINVEAVSGFDINSRSGVGYAALKVADKSAIYTINLTSGAATKLADMPTTVRAFAVGLGF